MGCGQSAGSLPMDEQTVVHGDIFNSETRTVLAILKICEIDYDFKKASLGNQDAISKDFLNISSFTPVIEHKGKKNVGSPSQIYIICAMNDQRNMLKRNAKGKIIKKKKGTPDAKSLYSPEQ